VTRPQADLSRESLAHRVEVLESRAHGVPTPVAPAAVAQVSAPQEISPAPPKRDTEAAAAVDATPEPAAEPEPAAPSAPEITLEQLRDAWTRSVLPALRERSIPTATLLDAAVPTAFDNDTVTLAFPSASAFHRTQVDDQKTLALIREALFEVTGRRLAVETVESETTHTHGDVDDETSSEDQVISLLMDTFNATEVEDPA